MSVDRCDFNGNLARYDGRHPGDDVNSRTRAGAEVDRDTLAAATAQNAWSTRLFTISVCAEGAQPQHLRRPVNSIHAWTSAASRGFPPELFHHHFFQGDAL